MPALPRLLLLFLLLGPLVFVNGFNFTAIPIPEAKAFMSTTPTYPDAHTAAAWGDFDLDGYLDLAITGGLSASSG